MRFTCITLMAVLAVATHAFAQSSSPDSGEEGTTLYLQAGLSSGSSDTGSAIGGTLVQELRGRLALEASGAYLDRGAGSDTLSLSVTLLFQMRPTREKAVPYFAIGGGLYRASFDMGNPRFYGPMDPGHLDSSGHGFGMMGPGSAGGTGSWMLGQMPMFYGTRMMGFQSGMGGHRSFTDPAVSLGGGVRVDVGSRLYLRPDARAVVVTSGGDTYTVGVLTVSFGYRF